MSLLRSYRLTNSIILHRRQLLCVPIELQQRRELGLYRRYENFLEKRYPKVYRVHRLIVDGCKSCGSDIKSYFVIRRALKNGTRSIGDLTEAELFSYIQTNQEAVKLLLIAIIAPLPFAFYGVAISVIFFPRHVLTRHFWTETQKEKFWRQFFKDSHKPQIQALTSFTCPKYTSKVPMQLEELNSVKMPDLNDLDLKHLFYLFRLHNISLFSGTNGLKKHAVLLAQLDDMVLRDPEFIETLSDIQLKNHLYVRRLSFADKSADEMRQYLRDWSKNLKHLSKDPTLYLHAPVILQSKNH